MFTKMPYNRKAILAYDFRKWEKLKEKKLSLQKSEHFIIKHAKFQDSRFSKVQLLL